MAIDQARKEELSLTKAPVVSFLQARPKYCARGIQWYRAAVWNEPVMFGVRTIFAGRRSRMDFEIEFLAVGDASKAGDAIICRYLGADGNSHIIIVDGGTDDTGQAIVDQINNTCGRNTFIDHVICSHPDSDHACGLRSVLGNFPVGTLWVHGLWHHAQQMLPFFEDKRWTVQGLTSKIRGEYAVIDELIKLAAEQETPVNEPFAGQVIGPFTVLSPTKYVYERLVPQFRKTPAPDVDQLKREQMWLEPRSENILAKMMGAVLEAAAQWVPEKWDIELLRDGAVTAAENETSTVLLGQFGATTVLLTADAGVNALTWAMDYADKNLIDRSRLELVQVPHHGSRSNVTPSILDRLIGPRLPYGTPQKMSAVVSAPKDDAAHPRKMVMNAFLRRGAPVRKTQGKYYRYYSGNTFVRANESEAVPFGFFDQVEGYD